MPEVTVNVEVRTRALLREVAEELGGDALRLPGDAIAIAGSPAKALLDRARRRPARRRPPRTRALASRVLGSVGLQCVLHAPCPVTVVPEQPVREPAAELADSVAAPAPA